MRQRTYLNTILTINAGLLAGLIWTQVADRPVMAQEAAAQSKPPVTGVPNAGDQRQKMIEHIQELNRSVQSLSRTIEGGKLRVEVTNLQELTASADTND